MDNKDVEQIIQDAELRKDDNVTAIRTGIESLLIKLYEATPTGSYLNISNTISKVFSSPLVTCYTIRSMGVKEKANDVEIRFVLNTDAADRIKSLKHHQEIIEKELKELSR